MVKAPALRPYLATIEQYCSPLDREALLQLILELARDVDSKKRGDFLDTVHALIQGSDISGAPATTTGQNELLEEIGQLQEEISNRIESIEDGSYWDDPDEGYDGYWDDEPDLISVEQQDELAGLFAQGDQLFIRGDKEGAEPVYKALFTLVDASGLENIDGCRMNLREARARYARCVYALSPENKRVQAMLSAIGGGFGDAEDTDFYHVYEENLPLLRDVMDAETGDLPGFDTFLPAWIKVLGRENVQEKRTADLLIEAAFLQGGLAAVGRLARQWKDRQPEGYLNWLARLEEQSECQELADVSNEALNLLPPGRERKKAAGYLLRAGKHLGDDVRLLTGYRERFRSGPTFANLVDLVQEAGRQEGRQAELRSICAFLGNKKSDYDDQSLLVTALLMAGELDQAFSFCSKAKPVGWSAESTGLLYSAILHLAAGSDARCTAIDTMLQNYSICDFPFDDDFPEDPQQYEQSCYQEIVSGLAVCDPTAATLDKYFQWAMDIGEKRINDIVTNKHRQAYGRAAGVLASLAEVLTAKGEREKARTLLHTYCRERYNRHRAFRQEVRQAVGGSRLLKGMEKGV